MMKIIIAGVTVGLFALFFACAQAANVLFIDLNNAEDELSAVEDALPTKGTHLVVMPPLSRFPEVQREAIFQTKRSFDKARRLAEHCTHGGATTCFEIWDALRTLELERERLTGAYDVNALIEDLMPHADTAFDIVVISGHHSRGYFRGEFSQLEFNDLARIDALIPKLFRSARTVILLGCETGTPEMLTSNFAYLFPSASVMIGAEDNAPTRSERRNLRFIDSVLKNEPRLHAARSASAAGKIHRQWVRARWPATLLWRGEHFFAKRWSGPIGGAAQGILAADMAEADRRARRRAAERRALLSARLSAVK